MNEEATPVEKKNNTHPPRGDARRRKKSHRRYPFDLKIKAVRLYLEEGFSGRLIAEETGVSQQALSGWIRLYQQFGEAGLKAHTPAAQRAAKLPPAVTAQIVALKKENPSFGIKRISQWLRRVLFLQASPESVRQKLHEAQLMPPPHAPKKRNLTRPRFFERATPNQMWQSDIFTFRLGGRYAYVVAFLDDYSRFIVGADLFRSPTAEAVIEVYRQAVAEFKPPKEMLTDNGRQYTSWRGTSRFEAELKKDGVAHFKSRPQHPMTLGKVERFWSSLWQDFLTRAQFDSFDSARERIRLWIKYYIPADKEMAFGRNQIEWIPKPTTKGHVEHGVLPLNNPPHCPRYNDAMEKSLGDFKRALSSRLLAPTEDRLLVAAVVTTIHDLNHRPRRCLGGKTACEVYHDPALRLRLDRPTRTRILRLLAGEFCRNVQLMAAQNQHALATVWRVTVQARLRRQGLIIVGLNQRPNQTVPPIFPKKWSHN